MKLGRIIEIGQKKHQPAFALVVTLVLMVLLTIIAVGLLSLSTISLRSASHEKSMALAKSNARLALMLAIGELQKTAGDDRRITADGSIISESAVAPHAVGVWESWTTGLVKNTQGSAPDYDQQKQDRFVRWLVSGLEDDLTDSNWVTSAASGEQVSLFSEEEDGFTLKGSLMSSQNGDIEGGYAWAISQENTKAKLSVAGPELADRDTNDDLQIQPRPNVGNVALSNVFSQPEGDWNQRAAKVFDYRQVSLDSELSSQTDASTLGADFTATSFGLLTDVVNGGLKVDLSLGFEMDDSDFESDTWTTDDGTISNPFRSVAELAFSTPSGYETQRLLYQPIVESGSLSYQRTWGSTGGNWDDDVHFYFPVTSVPTFDTLRSFYRIPHHLYQTSDGVTVFERDGDNIAAVAESEESIAGGHRAPPHIAANGATSQTAVRPVLDRVLYLFSLTLDSRRTPQYVITPVVTLWNPYNVALEIEGAVTYPWLDLPIIREFHVTTRGVTTNRRAYVSNDLKKGARPRQIPPFFYGAITADGNAITGSPTPIRFEPGEVRIFVPSSATPVPFTAIGSTVRQRTIFMRPVDSVSDYSITGGFAVQPQNDGLNDLPLLPGSKVSITFDMSDRGNTNTNYPFCVALTDATIAKGTGPSEAVRSLAITDVVADDFVDAHNLANESSALIVESQQFDFFQLLRGPQPVMSFEVYHRVAKGGSGTNAQLADLVYTGNPRQSSMNNFVTNANFQTGTQYKTRLRAISSSNELLAGLDTSGNRPAAYYGASQSSSSGRSHLSFFEVPRAPMLSLAGFQHADLASTPYAPANQFGNSWASAYVPRDRVVDGSDGREVDHSYLVNEALWDGYFFSGASPTLTPGTSGGSSNVWDSPVASETRSLTTVLKDFAEAPTLNPLRNPRMQLRSSSLNGMTPSEFAADMIKPDGSVRMASHLMLDGSFNINSTSVNAWTAILSGLRGASFELGDESATVDVTDTLFSRFRDPLGTENDEWHGFTSVSDTEIEELAEQIVEQVRLRGPFLSLAEFVNRRVDDSELGLSGALQTAIDATPSINQSALQGEFDDTDYDGSEANNIFPKDTGVGIPGFLTQADLLHSLAPVITTRSDTFTIRAYGEARNNSGEVTASAWVEACVQRYPEFVDDNDAAHTQTADLSPLNQQYGRKFEIVSFRYLTPGEAQKDAL
ncbi:MAG: hypothetical protein ACSHX9_13015 [Luteolibacter sp.]